MAGANTHVTCALCKSVINDTKTVITCTICNNNFHSQCVSENLRGFHLKKNWICKTVYCQDITKQSTETVEPESETFWDANGKMDKKFSNTF